MTARTIRDRPARAAGDGGARTEETARFDPALLDFVYPYQRETPLPAKVTATQLKGRPAGPGDRGECAPIPRTSGP